jgi:GntR family transcriptional regulator
VPLVKDIPAPLMPLHRQVRNSIEELIRTSNGKKAVLLSDAHLCERFNVSRITVRRAVKELVDAGLLYRIRGLGTFIRPRKTKEKLTLTSFLDAWTSKSEYLDVKVAAFQRMQASPSLAGHLGLKADAAILYIRRLRYKKRTLVVVDDRYLPAKYCKRLEPQDVMATSLLDHLRDHEHVDLGHGEMEIEARPATRGDCSLLGVRPGHPVLVRHVSFLTKSGDTALVGTSTYRADLVSYRFIISA